MSNHSKRDLGAWSKIATSPSRTSVRGDSFAMAAARSTKRLVWSRPFRLTRRTRSRSLYARMRQPSTERRELSCDVDAGVPVDGAGGSVDVVPAEDRPS